MSELLPTKASYRPGEPIAIELRGPAAGTLRVFHLETRVAEVPVDGEGLVTLPALPPGGYAVELGDLRTAVEVNAAPENRLRYGFVASYAPDKDVAAVADTVRRLHLNGMQFYDWAYRHADLMGGGEAYQDALDQTISLATVRKLIGAVQAAGSRALGYAAVYAVGPKEWPRWEHLGLDRADGTPWALGDFLYVLDPAAPQWLDHFTADLTAAVALGFDGFHLDQYGWPKRALRRDGVLVDVGQSFVTMLEAVRAALPSASLVFNNVNDFPTRLTAATAQDALYIEPWEPQLTLQSLADTVTATRAVAGDRPVVMAAYQHVYAETPGEAADRATALTMATLHSHGATQLLAGEADRLLCDPYYVRNHVLAPDTAALLRRWYDFLVAHDELLMPSDLTDVTNAYAGSYNGELEVNYTGIALSQRAEAGTVWRRIVKAGDRLVIHLINVVGQANTLWDRPREPFAPLPAGTLTIRPIRSRTPRVHVADPDGAGRLLPVEVVQGSETFTAVLPPLRVWQMVVVDL